MASSALSDLRDKVKHNVSFLLLAQEYGVQFDRSGFARCPFHSERTASFHVYQNTGYCFGCGWRGDVISFVRQYYGMSFVDALHKLCDDFAIAYDGSERFSEWRNRNIEMRKRKTRLDELQRQYNDAKEHADDMLNLYIICERFIESFPPGNDMHDLAEREIERIKYLCEEAEIELGLASENLYCKT